jgi:hypothetical protein
VYAGAAFAGFLNPSLRGYFDVGAIHGGYWTGDVSHTIVLAKLASHVTWAAVLAAGAGCGSANHNAFYYGVKRLALADLHPSVSLPLNRGRFQLTPKLGYGMLLDPALRAGPATKAHGFNVGVGLAVTL